jgi:hypothetical protein
MVRPSRRKTGRGHLRESPPEGPPGKGTNVAGSPK